MLDRYEYQEGRRSHLCCHLLFWMLQGTLSMPGLCSGHPVVLFLEHGIESEGNLWQASTATCTLCISAPGGNWPSPVLLRDAPWVVPCAGNVTLVGPACGAEQRGGCCGLVSPETWLWGHGTAPSSRNIRMQPASELNAGQLVVLL